MSPSRAVVFVVAPPPKARFIAPLRRGVEPLVHPPDAVQSAAIGRIGVVRHRPRTQTRSCPAARAYSRAHPFHIRPQSRRRTPGPVYSSIAAPRRELCSKTPSRCFPRFRHVEVEVEVAATRTLMGTSIPPAACTATAWQAASATPPKACVVVGQVDDETVEAVRDRRARPAPRREIGPQREVVARSCERPWMRSASAHCRHRSRSGKPYPSGPRAALGAAAPARRYAAPAPSRPSSSSNRPRVILTVPVLWTVSFTAQRAGRDSAVRAQLRGRSLSPRGWDGPPWRRGVLPDGRASRLEHRRRPRAG